MPYSQATLIHALTNLDIARDNVRVQGLILEELYQLEHHPALRSTLLHVYCAECNEPMVSFLLNNGYKQFLNWHDEEGNTAFHRGVQCFLQENQPNHLAVINKLLNLGVKAALSSEELNNLGETILAYENWPLYDLLQNAPMECTETTRPSIALADCDGIKPVVIVESGSLTQLANACRTENEEQVKALLASGAEVLPDVTFCNTPLYLMIEKGKLSWVKQIRGLVDVINRLTSRECFELAKIICKNQSKDLWAYLSDNTAISAMLDLDQHYALTELMQAGRTPGEEEFVIVEKVESTAPLAWSSQAADAPAVIMGKDGCSVLSSGTILLPPLQLEQVPSSINPEIIELCKALKTKPINPKFPTPPLDDLLFNVLKEYKGLIQAQEEHKAKQALVDAAYIVSQGASPNITLFVWDDNDIEYTSKPTRDATPLHLACRVENRALAEALVKAGANIHKRNAYGETAYDLACAGEYIEIVDMLISNQPIAQSSSFVQPIGDACHFTEADFKAIVPYILWEVSTMELNSELIQMLDNWAISRDNSQHVQVVTELVKKWVIKESIIDTTNGIPIKFLSMLQNAMLKAEFHSSHSIVECLLASKILSKTDMDLEVLQQIHTDFKAADASNRTELAAIWRGAVKGRLESSVLAKFIDLDQGMEFFAAEIALFLLPATKHTICKVYLHALGDDQNSDDTLLEEDCGVNSFDSEVNSSISGGSTPEPGEKGESSAFS